ncbi:3545_t:CDS:2, partial [Entrophospora sp. SA101]
NEKAAGYMNGKVYLTSHRIVYVDSVNPHTNLITIDLQLIKGREFYAGFVKSSPKITLHQKNETLTTTPSSNDENSEIACPMCTFLNHS